MDPAIEPWVGLSVFGALARSVRDSALMLDVLAGTDAFAKAAAGPPAKKLRIAISRKIPPPLIARVSADQRGAWESTASLLTELGHEVVERDPAYGLAMIDFMQRWLRGIHDDAAKVPEPAKMERLTRQMAAPGRLVTDRRRARMIAEQPASAARILRLWDEVDVLMTPGLARTALPAKGGFGKPAPLAIDVSGRFTPFTMLFNHTGQPAMTVPAGIGEDGLPLSVQLVGRPNDEATLYSLGAQLEEARPWADRRPPVS